MSMYPEPQRRGGGAVVRRGTEIALQAHAVTWLLVNILLVAIWAVVGFGYFWPFWTIVPWGVVLAFHAWATYGWRSR